MVNKWEVWCENQTHMNISYLALFYSITYWKSFWICVSHIRHNNKTYTLLIKCIYEISVYWVFHGRLFAYIQVCIKQLNSSRKFSFSDLWIESTWTWSWGNYLGYKYNLTNILISQMYFYNIKVIFCNINSFEARNLLLFNEQIIIKQFPINL